MIFALNGALAQTAGWRTFPIDDSLTQAPAVQLRWRDALPSTDSASLLAAVAEVRIVLNVGQWLGKSARIYMLMPPQPLSSMAAQWVTSGTLLPGRLSGGQRQLVFQGPISSSQLRDTMRITLSADARDAMNPSHLNLGFEIEVPGS
jgi:hypothetical protein